MISSVRPIAALKVLSLFIAMFSFPMANAKKLSVSHLLVLALVTAFWNPLASAGVGQFLSCSNTSGTTLEAFSVTVLSDDPIGSFDAFISIRLKKSGQDEEVVYTTIDGQAEVKDETDFTIVAVGQFSHLQNILGKGLVLTVTKQQGVVSYGGNLEFLSCNTGLSGQIKSLVESCVRKDLMLSGASNDKARNQANCLTPALIAKSEEDLYNPFNFSQDPILGWRYYSVVTSVDEESLTGYYQLRSSPQGDNDNDSCIFFRLAKSGNRYLISKTEHMGFDGGQKFCQKK